MEEKNYGAELVEEGYQEMLFYGIGFYKKQVRVHGKRKVIC
ncbi:MAG: hypothetical protein Q4B70_13640 [Lachnospiraceae bacterium]|nr:hypothetical protein [Lachnospiraceae bacterium]